MHELFISAAIMPNEVAQTLKVMQGHTHMRPQEQWKRKMDFKGPKGDPPHPGLPKDMMKPMSGPFSTPIAEKKKEASWVALNERMMKQSYYISCLWREDPDKNAPPPIDVNLRPGTLKFTERPDPNTIPIVSREIIEIENEHYIPNRLEKAGYTLCTEIFQELHVCWQPTGTTFTLSRILVNPDTNSPNVKQLKSRDKCRAYGGKWLLTVSILVEDGSKPDQMNKGREVLLKVIKDLGGVFHFDVVTASSLDPRSRWA